MRDALDHLPPLGLEALFTELQSRKGDAPRVTLRLDSGHTITGDLLAFADGQVLLRDLQTGGGLDATYLPLQAIRAATVHYLRANIHVAAQGGLPPLPAHVPTRLELKRLAGQVAVSTRDALGQDMPVDVDWDGWPKTGLASVRLGGLLTELQQVLTALATDAMGSAALREGVDRVRIQAGAEGPEVLVRGRLLTVLGRTTGDDVRTPDDLRAAVEKAL